jgi:hypothetical protein
MEHYEFDEQNLREIGRKYRTLVIMTDYVRRVEVYKGSLDESCFDMINFYVDNGWLDNCTWTKVETPLRGDWKRLVMEAKDESGEEIFNVTIKIKEKEMAMEKTSNGMPSNGKMFLIGLVSAFFPLEKVVEFFGLWWLFDKATNKKR